MEEHLWIVVTLLCGVLAGTLAWGLGRRRSAWAATDNPAGSEGMQDPNEVPDVRIVVARGTPTLPPIFIQHRLRLRRLWGIDQPDLQLTAWNTPMEDGFAAQYEVRQFILPLPEEEDGCAQLLERIATGVEGRGTTEERDLQNFLCAWFFMYSPRFQADAVVRLRWSGKRFQHDYFVLQDDGRLDAMPPEEFAFPEVLTHAQRMYRNAVARWIENHDPDESRPDFEAVLEEELHRGGCHAWLACLEWRADEDIAAARRHLACATEWSPDLPSTQQARWEIARMPEREGARRVADVRLMSAESACLVAQSYLAIGQLAPARRLCDEILAAHPAHREARSLIDLIQQRERRAET